MIVWAPDEHAEGLRAALPGDVEVGRPDDAASTGETRGFVNREFLARMRDGALFVNAGRGALADTEALLEAAGRLRLALDVTDPEPLPDGHPLWTAPGVVISSHVAGDSPESFVRAYEPVAAQVPRFREGRPLLNVVRA